MRHVVLTIVSGRSERHSLRFSSYRATVNMPKAPLLLQAHTHLQDGSVYSQPWPVFSCRSQPEGRVFIASSAFLAWLLKGSGQ